MAQLPTPAEVQQWADELRNLLDAVTHQVPGFHQRLKYAARDGYPSTSMGARVSGGSTSDPVVNTVLGNNVADPVRLDYQAIARYVRESRDNMRAADGLLQKNSQPEKKRELSIVDCVNCGEPALPRPRSGRCESCYRWRKRHNGQERPPEQWDRQAS